MEEKNIDKFEDLRSFIIWKKNNEDEETKQLEQWHR